MDAWGIADEIVLIGAGDPIPIPGGADQRYPFRVHPDYLWLTGRRRPGGVLALDPRDGWELFEPEVTEAERLWEGAVHEAIGRPVRELDAWLERRRGRPLALLGAPPYGASRREGDLERGRVLAEALLHERRPKDEHELRLVRAAIDATAAGFARAREVIEPGVSERHVQIELETAMFHAGAQRLGYDTIVGSGPNSAVLHGAPSARTIGPRDLVLVDAGGSIDDYCADVTRTFAAGGHPGAEQRALLEMVEQAQRAALRACWPGVEWRDVHTVAAREIAAGLIDARLLRGRVDDRIDDASIALFFPHGVGHMFGLGVRDAGGRLPGRRESALCCGVTLRLDLPLEVNYLVTVEPGAYLVPALLRDRGRRERYADAVNWDEVDRWLGLQVGGVRIEDNVVVTEEGCEVLTGGIGK